MVLPFTEKERTQFYQQCNEIFDSNFWSDGLKTKQFEKMFEEHIGVGAKSISSGGAGLLAIMNYIDVSGKEVIIPNNTFWADARAVQEAGGIPVFADCNRDDLCLSVEDVERRITSKTKAVIVVHIGGHIAFQINELVDLCERKGIALIEDCAHAHGAEWNGKRAGTFGIAGSYSFYATKTLPIGDGGMVVSKNQDLLNWVEKYRNYGKDVKNGVVTYPITSGFNFRISEFSAALGIVQMTQLQKIIEFKRHLAAKYDQIFQNRVKFPEGMISGYYKYIVFDYELTQETGKVFSNTDFGTNILQLTEALPNSEWVGLHHSCVPIYYGYENASLSVENLQKLLIKR